MHSICCIQLRIGHLHVAHQVAKWLFCKTYSAYSREIALHILTNKLLTNSISYSVNMTYTGRSHYFAYFITDVVFIVIK